MTSIVVTCDVCRNKSEVRVRQAHEARRQVASAGWTQRPNRFNANRIDDLCPRCSNTALYQLD